MENVTIKQLLDAGAYIKISFHHNNNEQEAIEKIRSIDYDGDLTINKLDDETMVVSHENIKLWISSFY